MARGSRVTDFAQGWRSPRKVDNASQHHYKRTSTRAISRNPSPPKPYGLGGGVGRGLGVGANLGVGEGLAVDVGVGDTVAVAVAVDVGVGDTVAVAVGVDVGVEEAVPCVAVGVDVGVEVAVLVAVAVGVGVGVPPTCTSNEPMSIPLPLTRANPGPRWSKKGGGAKLGSPASMAGLPGKRACVKVGPPLSCSGPSIGSVLI